MLALEMLGAWLGASALLLGFLAWCDWRTQRRLRRDKIIRQVNDASRI